MLLVFMGAPKFFKKIIPKNRLIKDWFPGVAATAVLKAFIEEICLFWMRFDMTIQLKKAVQIKLTNVSQCDKLIFLIKSFGSFIISTF